MGTFWEAALGDVQQFNLLYVVAEKKRDRVSLRKCLSRADKAPLTIMGEVKQLKDDGFDVELKDGAGNVVPTGPKRGKA